MAVITAYGTGYSLTSPSEAQLLGRRKEDPRNGTVPLILGLHGHGGGAQQYTPWNLPNAGGPVYHVYKLIEAGYMVLGIDAGGPTAWSDQAAMDRITDALNWAGTQGLRVGRVGVMGWSMGSFTALNWMKRNPSRVACAWLWTPASDLDFFYNVGYTPSYGNANNVVPGTQYTQEILDAYGGSYANSAGFRIHDEPASWRGIAPMRLAHAPDDGTIPMEQSQSFVAAVNDPQVTFRQVPSGGHTNLFVNVPPLEVIQHYQSRLV